MKGQLKTNIVCPISNHLSLKILLLEVKYCSLLLRDNSLMTPILDLIKITLIRQLQNTIIERITIT